MIICKCLFHSVHFSIGRLGLGACDSDSVSDSNACDSVSDSDSAGEESDSEGGDSTTALLEIRGRV